MDLTSSSSSDESYKPSPNKKSHICTYEGCTASFAKPSKLTYHIRRHTGERPFACDEPNCTKTYLYSFHLRRHKETHYNKRTIERLSCPHPGCYMELANKYTLKKHMKMKHNPERYYAFSCEECKQGFHRKRQLLQHSYIHTGIFPFKCDICSTTFPTNRDRSRHKRTHTSYPCKCGQTFERWSSLLVHKKMCETIRPKCDICKKTFARRGNLKRHLNLHVDENTEVYICGYVNCTRSYSYKKNLIYHINKYHKKVELPRIACTEPGCKKSFTKKQNLMHHINRFHTSKKSSKTKQRNRRKDKGMSRMSTAAVLAGLQLPLRLHRAIIKGLPVKLTTAKKFDSKLKEGNDNVGNAKENMKVSQVAVKKLKDKLKQALLNNRRNKLRRSSDEMNDSKNKKLVKLVC